MAEGRQSFPDSFSAVCAAGYKLYTSPPACVRASAEQTAGQQAQGPETNWSSL